MANKPKRFRAVLEKGKRGLGWTVVRLPFDPHKAWSEMIRLRVRGNVTSANAAKVDFRTSLFPAQDVKDQYVLLVNNQVQQQAGISLGSVAEFELEADLSPRPAELPEELASLLDEEPGLRDYYDEFSESMRREIGKWVMQPRSAESQTTRAEQMAERLLGAMEGEQQLPPILAVAFQKRPKAKAGWAKLTQTQRRQELLAIFYYKTVESRQRRVDKLCDNAEKRFKNSEAG